MATRQSKLTTTNSEATATNTEAAAVALLIPAEASFAEAQNILNQAVAQAHEAAYFHRLAQTDPKEPYPANRLEAPGVYFDRISEAAQHLKGMLS